MTNEEILKKTIEKACRTGIWLNKWSVNARIDDDGVFRSSEIEPEDAFNIIFDHDFAKAFWGEGRNRKRFELNNTIENNCDEGYCEYFCQPWQYHLQQMVLEEDPVKYLEQFL